MKIDRGRPPQWIWDELHRLFTIDDKITVYIVGDTIFNPGGIFVYDSLLAHEATHGAQQLLHGTDDWWKAYLANAEFRTDQELKAYQEQYAHYCTQNKDRERRFHYRNELAKALTSNLYKAAITYHQALSKIQNNIFP